MVLWWVKNTQLRMEFCSTGQDCNFMCEMNTIRNIKGCRNQDGIQEGRVITYSIKYTKTKVLTIMRERRQVQGIF